MIRTVPRRGYRFDTVVERIEPLGGTALWIGFSGWPDLRLDARPDAPLDRKVAAQRWTLQQDLAQRIANLLDTRLHDAHLPPSDLDGTRSGAAAATLQGMTLIRPIQRRDDLLKARALLDGALQADPDSVPAPTYWGLSHILEVSRRWSTDRESQMALASRAFERALHGRGEQARANLAKYQRILPGHTISSLKATESSRNPDFWAERERFYTGLKLAGVPE